MVLILTICSGLALLLLLAVLAWALGRIATALQCVTSSLQKIAWGVRAIETETSHLLPSVTTLNSGFEALSGGFDSVAQQLTKLS